MIKIHLIHDTQLANIPPPYHSAVTHAVQNLCSIYGPDPHPEDQGFVVFVEPEDEPLHISNVINRNISKTLEGVFRDGICLVGVVIYGNSGSGVTIVCPEVEGYASTIANIFRNHL